MKKIALTKGQFASVDDDDFEYLNQFKWIYHGEGYAVRNVYSREAGKKKLTTVLMHRLINKTPTGMLTDHIDGNPLNNSKNNLRTCTYRQNHMNRRKLSGSSKYKGIIINKNKSEITYTAIVSPNNKRKRLGTFKSEIEAAKAYDTEAKKLYGEFAKLNFA